MQMYNPYYQQQSAYQNNTYNPIVNAQQRIAQMEMQYPQFAQQNMFATQMSGTPISLAGRIVDDFSTITANDVPMDGTGAIFIKRDNSEIQHKIWSASDGKLVTTTYKPILDAKNSETDISSSNVEKLKIDLSETSTKAFMERFDVLENLITGKKVKRNAKSDTDDANSKKSANVFESNDEQ